MDWSLLLVTESQKQLQVQNNKIKSKNKIDNFVAATGYLCKLIACRVLCEDDCSGVARQIPFDEQVLSSCFVLSYVANTKLPLVRQRYDSLQ